MLLNQSSMNLKTMFFKRSLALVVAAASVAIVAAAFLTPNSESLLSSVFKEEVRNSLSGRVGTDGPILAVKIDDTKMAHPQIGIEFADIVYIEQVEGGLTRLAALFASQIPKEIGPVRSARISDLELLSQFGKVGFAYSGAQQKLRPEIAAANLFDLGAQRMSSTIYTTDPQRIQPYAMVLRADLFMEYAQEKGFEFAQSKSAGWNFSDETKLGTAISSAKVSWPANSYEVFWSTEKEVWELSHGGVPNLSSTGARLTADTFVIQLVSITDSIYKDKVGGVTPFSATVGTGKGFILRDGKYIEGNWSRPTESAGTRWTTNSGDEIPFAHGAIWIALTDKAPSFTPIPADASRTGTK